MALLTGHTLWLLPLVLLVGAGYAMFLYFRNDNVVFERKPKIVMAVLRGISMSLIAFLLLAPMLMMTVKQTEKPVVVVAVDNSESLGATADSAYYRNGGYQKDVRKLIDALGDGYEVRPYLVGDRPMPVEEGQNLEVDLSDKTTDLATMFEQTEMLYSGTNIGAVVMISDGIYNTGANPYYRASKAGCPVYTVGLGNTEFPVDLSFADVKTNRQALKGNMFPVELKVSAGKLSGKSAELTVFEGDERLYSKNIAISGNRFFETVRFSLEAKSAGIHRYRAELTELEGEITHKNNHIQFFIEVIEAKDKIAIVYNSPHPDIAAIGEALALTENYDVEVASAADFKGNAADYSLIILHQLPSRANPSSNLLSQMRKSNVPALYVIGQQTDLNAFNALNAGLTVAQNGTLLNNAMPLLNDNFTLFTCSEEMRQVYKQLPPVKTVFGTYKTAVSAEVFLYQKISGVETKYPLVLFNGRDGMKSGVIAGSGIWMWKLYDYMYAGNHDAFNETVQKIAQYLAVKGDKSQFRVHHQDVIAENMPVEFTAELFNDSYELINEPDVKLSVKGGGDTLYEAQFSKQNNGYYLDMGELPSGNYSWTATTEIGNRRLEKKGHFAVQPVVVETANLVADHELLKNMASATGGRFFTQAEMQNVAQEIKANDNIKPIASYRKKYSVLLNSPWYLAAIVLLLGIEWFLRKWNGGY